MRVCVFVEETERGRKGTTTKVNKSETHVGGKKIKEEVLFFLLLVSFLFHLPTETGKSVPLAVTCCTDKRSTLLISCSLEPFYYYYYYYVYYYVVVKIRTLPLSLYSALLLVVAWRGDGVSCVVVFEPPLPSSPPSSRVSKHTLDQPLESNFIFLGRAICVFVR